MSDPSQPDSPAPRRGFSIASAWPAIAAVALVLGVLASRSTLEHMQAYERAVQYEKAGNIDSAIDEYRWALRWYTPWGPWHTDAAEALWDIGERALDANPERTVRAWDGLRSGLLTGRSFYQPGADTIAKVNAKIPAVLVRMAQRRGDTRPPDKLLERFTADYARRVGVPIWASLAVSFGFLLWVAGLVFAFARGTDDDGRLRANGWRWLGAALVGFIAWTLAMWLA